jgi:hypothetical protein
LMRFISIFSLLSFLPGEIFCQLLAPLLCPPQRDEFLIFLFFSSLIRLFVLAHLSWLWMYSARSDASFYVYTTTLAVVHL